MADQVAFREMVQAAVEVLRGLGRPLDEVLDLDGVSVAERTPAVAHALGVLEGAAVTLGLTELELLDAHGLLS